MNLYFFTNIKNTLVSIDSPGNDEWVTYCSTSLCSYLPFIRVIWAFKTIIIIFLLLLKEHFSHLPFLIYSHVNLI